MSKEYKTYNVALIEVSFNVIEINHSFEELTKRISYSGSLNVSKPLPGNVAEMESFCITVLDDSDNVARDELCKMMALREPFTICVDYKNDEGENNSTVLLSNVVLRRFELAGRDQDSDNEECDTFITADFSFVGSQLV